MLLLCACLCRCSNNKCPTPVCTPDTVARMQSKELSETLLRGIDAGVVVVLQVRVVHCGLNCVSACCQGVEHKP